MSSDGDSDYSLATTSDEETTPQAGPSGPTINLIAAVIFPSLVKSLEAQRSANFKDTTQQVADYMRAEFELVAQHTVEEPEHFVFQTVPGS